VRTWAEYVGWLRLKVSGPAGTTVTLRHAEVLDKAGNFYTENLRAAKQTVRYTLKGEGKRCYEPRFTFQGFRYVQVQGFRPSSSRENLPVSWCIRRSLRQELRVLQSDA